MAVQGHFKAIWRDKIQNFSPRREPRSRLRQIHTKGLGAVINIFHFFLWCMLYLYLCYFVYNMWCEEVCNVDQFHRTFIGQIPGIEVFKEVGVSHFTFLIALVPRRTALDVLIHLRRDHDMECTLVTVSITVSIIVSIIVTYTTFYASKMYATTSLVLIVTARI